MAVYVHDLLTKALEQPGAREWALSHTITPYTVGPAAVEIVSNVLTKMSAEAFATHLIGGLTKSELLKYTNGEFKKHSLAAAAASESTFVLPPLPNHLFTRDSSCWLYGGVSLNPMFWKARQAETVSLPRGTSGCCTDRHRVAALECGTTAQSRVPSG